jgi:hypothetical protein
MTINELIKKRGIADILHFTTGKGITGILATSALKSRSLLPKEAHLEYIYKYNCPDNSRVRGWYNYVNLSVTSVNRHLFGISSGKWHTDEAWWAVLSFKPEICTHDGVYFTTTNNMYTGVNRQQGYKGLEAMFAPEITQWVDKTIIRLSSIPDNQPTCQQAEILYPLEVSLKYLKKVYVVNDDDASRFDSIKVLFQDWKNIPCEVNKNFFS